jgi:hypothetical protein
MENRSGLVVDPRLGEVNGYASCVVRALGQHAFHFLFARGALNFGRKRR